MPAPYILARSLKEAHAFARQELGLSRGQYRIVMSPSTLTAVRGADLYLVPGWERRHDKFSMRGALRWTRLNKVDGGNLEHHGEPDGLEPLGEQLTIEEAHAFLMAAGEYDEALASLAELDPGVAEAAEARHEHIQTAVVQAETLAVDEDTSNGHNMEAEGAPAVKRRRRRCKECGILVDPDEVEQHAAEHLPEGD